MPFAEARQSPRPGAATIAWTAGALLSFAANSWLCRAALRARAIDPASFTLIRLAAGALVLGLLAELARRPPPAGAAGEPAPRDAGGGRGNRGDWRSALALSGYAILFSLAYLELDAGAGALLLFGAVQATMLLGGIAGGHRPAAAELAGLALALAGLAWLAAPGRSAPAPLAAGAMALAGVAWGIYSLRGRAATRPLITNAGNFLRAVPIALAALAVAAGATGGGLQASAAGITLAVLSGGVTSGLGYAAWYAALPRLTPAQAGVVQLAVPVLAAVGGVVLLDERWTLRLVGSGMLVVAGIGLALAGSRRR